VEDSIALPRSRRPRLRPLEPQWVHVDGEDHLLLRDPLELAGGDRAVLVPGFLVPLLAACDGTRDLEGLGREMAARSGVRLEPGTVERLVDALDGALLLEGPRFQRARAGALAEYRRQPFRPPALAGRSYPPDVAALEALFRGFGATGAGSEPVAPLGAIRRASGVLSPHIDYARGGPVYAATWEAALPAVASAEVVVVFGTDHAGSGGRLTPTRVPYATPWGPLPLDVEAVRALGRALGEGPAYDEELHHKREHSIELAAVWLHWALRRAGRDGDALPPLVPVLCGSFHPYVSYVPYAEPRAPAVDGLVGPDGRPIGRGPSAPTGCPVPEDEPALAGALDALADAVSDRKALVVSAADLAHVGPAFGDDAPLDAAARADLATSDARLLGPAVEGSAAGFLDLLRAQGDRTRVCGLPPTYWALRLLERLEGRPVPGRLAGYRQCPADEAFGSVVSIAGVIWEEGAPEALATDP
jgi:MEMO1 family protein